MAQEKSQTTKSQALFSSPRLTNDILPSERQKLTIQEQKRLHDAFLIAAEKGNNTEIEQLLDAGADIGAMDSYSHMTALHLAADKGHTETCALLIRKYAELGNGLKQPVNDPELELRYGTIYGTIYGSKWGGVKEFISAKARRNETAMHRAAERGHTLTCLLLMQEYAKAGGDMNELVAMGNCNGFTAVDKAAGVTKQVIKHAPLLHNLLDNETLISFVTSFAECTSQ
jgi:ankyrin repeat protein